MPRTYYSSTRAKFKPRRNTGFQGNRNRSSRKRRGQYIDPSRFIKKAKPITEGTEYTPVNSFEDFNVNQLIKDNIKKAGIIKPSIIQDKTLPLSLSGRDVIGIANTGTGKTIAFLLPILDKIMSNRQDKALIIAPTRELALQIKEEAKWLSEGNHVKSVLLIGGTPIGRQLRDLQRRPSIIVGTPGRIKDHIERGSLRLSNVSTAVLDEVDRMLDMGFIKDIKFILDKLPKERHSMFFSATMGPTIDGLIKPFSNDPITIIAKTAETSDNVEQSIIKYSADTDKIDKLHNLLITDHVKKTLIFCETKRSTEKLSKELITRGFTSDAMHGNKSQGQRQRALGKFKDGHVGILVATDVAARGIDVDSITHVINYDIPQTYDDYTHRIGRTGRGDKTGYAVTFVGNK